MGYTPFLAAFTEDGCGVVVVSLDRYCYEPQIPYQIEKFDLVKQNGQIYRTTPRDDSLPFKLSEYGSYVAFAEHKNGDTRICIWKTDDNDDISIPLGCADKVLDLDLTGESAHLVAVITKDITILSIPLGAVQRTLYHEGANRVCISHDGSFLASQTSECEARLWSITQGTLLATFKIAERYPMVFSRTNRLYVTQSNDEWIFSGIVYDVSADPNNITIKSFPLPSLTVRFPIPVRHTTTSILPAPDESQILIRTWDDIQVWRQFMDRDASCDNIIGIGLSGDASRLALATKTDIEIWDARIGQRLHVIQSRSSSEYSRPVAFSRKGELIVSTSDDDGIVVVDVNSDGCTVAYNIFVFTAGTRPFRDAL